MRGSAERFQRPVPLASGVQRDHCRKDWQGSEGLEMLGAEWASRSGVLGIEADTITDKAALFTYFILYFLWTIMNFYFFILIFYVLLFILLQLFQLFLP